jgi:hypothetical protein
MAQETVTAAQLHPNNADIRQATIDAFAHQEGLDAHAFLDQLASATAPAPIGATASLNVAIWGKLLVEPDGQAWKYDVTVWGGPAYFGSSVGFMYTAYDSWDAFFRNVESCWVQGAEVGGGVLQVNWFDGNHTPVGQFNGVAGGAGIVEAGNSGRWQPK